MLNFVEKTTEAVISAEEERCPFLGDDGEKCQVVRTGVTVSWRRNSAHCSSGDYDACNRFLTQVLQCSSSRSVQELWPLQQK